MLIYRKKIKFFPTHQRGYFDEFFVAESMANKIKEESEVVFGIHHEILYTPSLQKLIQIISGIDVPPTDTEHLNRIKLN